MKKFAMLFVLFAATVVFGACAHGPCPGGPHGGRVAREKAPQGSGAIYWCNCGPECKCNSVSTHPGKCGCGKELAGGHVVFTEGNTVLACTCGPSCTCVIDPNDHTKCGCGKPVKKIDLKGTGLYFCNCRGACGCSSVSDKPGPCTTCGMPMHQAQ